MALDYLIEEAKDLNETQVQFLVGIIRLMKQQGEDAKRKAAKNAAASTF